MSAATGRPLAGLHAVVTGASRGIGEAAVEELARLGANLTLMGRDAARLEANADRLRRQSDIRTAAVAVDVGRPEGIVRAFAQATEALGAVTILVNNAGVASAAPAVRTSLDEWNRLLAIDLTGPFLCTQQVLKGMVAAKFGRIVNVASTAGLTGYAYVAAYCAAKHGLIGLTRALAIELARSGVTVNAVCPGYTDTAIVAETVNKIVAKTGRTPDQALAELTAHNPQGRLVRPDEVASSIGWLCLPASAAVTGQSILVAGGELM
ncbi:MAG TPA: SDR family NAD(P)-dependent oxidoreductase [Burkholderiaceae bacterium]